MCGGMMNDKNTLRLLLNHLGFSMYVRMYEYIAVN